MQIRTEGVPPLPPFSRLSRTGTVAVTLSAALTLSFGLTAFASDALAQTANTAETPAALSKTLPGKIVYTQLTTPDLPKAKAFYGALLGWNFQDRPVSRGHYAEALVNGHVVAGLVERPLPDTDNPPQPLWLPFISALDVPTVAKESLQWGGKILYRPTVVPGRGEQAIIADPQGALFAALHTSHGDRDDTDDTAQGDWIWHTILTPAPAASAGFYQKLFGYQVEDAPPPDTHQHYILDSQSIARATVNPLPARLPPDASARWIGFIQVDSVGSAAEKAVQLGGRVLVQPHPDHQNSMIAVLADPSGAAFGVMEWHDPSAAGDAK
ncbi:VOC family protein [Gluconobacter sp. Dm-74]|uniref:VOC family protein n=1 Tax=Gluconobacter sp. Dm-74 TaxID=2799803 RepID=UPI0032C49E4B